MADLSAIRVAGGARTHRPAGPRLSWRPEMGGIWEATVRRTYLTPFELPGGGARTGSPLARRRELMAGSAASHRGHSLGANFGGVASLVGSAPRSTSWWDGLPAGVAGTRGGDGPADPQAPSGVRERKLGREEGRKEKGGRKRADIAGGRKRSKGEVEAAPPSALTGTRIAVQINVRRASRS